MQNEPTDLSLRDTTPDDHAFLLDVYASTRLEELAETGWDDNQKLAFIRMQFLVRERTYPKSDSKIVLCNGLPVGRLMVDRGDEAILLRDIALLPEYRNAGIGSRLIRELMQDAASAGKPVRLHVLATSPAVRLYERLGFRTSGNEAGAAYLEMSWVPATKLN
jgi:ribosomal protein S18 acetylase RimI-like enzyme